MGRSHAALLAEILSKAAKAFGWNVNTYRSHENGTRGLSKKAARSYSRAFQIPVSWLMYAEGRGPDRESFLENVERVATRRVPLISFVEAGQMTEISDPYEVGACEQEVSLDEARDVGARAFALRVQGDSMLCRSANCDHRFAD